MSFSIEFAFISCTSESGLILFLGTSLIVILVDWFVAFFCPLTVFISRLYFCCTKCS
ncbi:hypothetical protein BC829DRAFT_392008 [Chytridium lagenaria]|nr:hypothetical protein BC829DRAFT_392008 [Chytridium lagenaria]